MVSFQTLKKTLVSASDGTPTLKIVIGGRNGREEYLFQRETKRTLQELILTSQKIIFKK